MRTVDVDNPYVELGGRDGTTDELHKLRKQLLASMSAIVALSLTIVVLSASTFYFAVMRQPKDHVIEVDNQNRIMYGGALDARTLDLDLYIPNEIIRFVENWRMVTGDNTMQKLAATRLYCMLVPESAAGTRIDNYYKKPENDPFEINQDRTRTVALRNILQQTDKTWNVEWSETVRNHNGKVMDQPRVVKAQMVINRGASRESCKATNPLGIYMMDLNWSSVL